MFSSDMCSAAILLETSSFKTSLLLLYFNRRRWFHMSSLFCHYFLFISSYFGVSGRLCCLILAFSGNLYAPPMADEHIVITLYVCMFGCVCGRVCVCVTKIASGP